MLKLNVAPWELMSGVTRLSLIRGQELFLHKSLIGSGCRIPLRPWLQRSDASVIQGIGHLADERRHIFGHTHLPTTRTRFP